MNKIKIETIFDLMKNKEQRGFELLYKYHFRTIYGIAFTQVKNEEMSYDVVQNVFMKLYSLECDKYPRSNEMTWLYKVTKNEALQILRREKPVVSSEEIFEIAQMDSSIDEFTDMDSYHSMIRGLNDKQKNVVTLKVLGGLSHREIANMLDKPIGTIQWIYNTSIKKLRRTLEVLVSFVLILGVAANRRWSYLKRTSDQWVPEMNGPIEIIPFEPFKDTQFLLFLSLFIVVVLSTIIFFKKSDKVPTK